MCGISGIINFDQEAISAQKIRSMMAIMKHRGPDDEGLFLEGNTGLGFVRLSILDLSPAGHQPMFSPDERYVLAFNGEIFNYIELREELKTLGHAFKSNTDSEVLLTAYLEWGEACLHRFNGMWAFAIYDRQEKSLFIARDRYGIKPLYYLQTGRFFAFASEIPPLLALLPGKPTPDYQSSLDYLVFNSSLLGKLKLPYDYYLKAKKFNSLKYINTVSCPKLVIAGELDKNVSLESIKKLYNMSNEPKELVVIENMDHNYKKSPKIIKHVNQKILDFIENIG